MESALQYYGYTDRTPSAWHLAVDKHSTKSRFDIEYPIVSLITFRCSNLCLALIVLKSGVNLKIFNRERVVCDCLRQENKMDVEVFNKAIQAYVKDPMKNVPRLMEYATLLRTEKKVRKVIGVWLWRMIWELPYWHG